MERLLSRRRTFAFAAALALAAAGSAQSKTYTVGGASPAQQLAQVESRADFELFTGRTDKVSGTIVFDPKAGQGSGTLTVDAASIETGIALRDEHMRSPQWLDTEKYKTITFKTENVRKTGTDTYRVYGSFTLRGVTRKITTTVTLRHRPASEATRKAGFKGDVVQVRTSFDVKLADYGIKIPAQAAGKVAETVTISLTVYGQTG
jgi:polyisoprenoid-binding protein YceI